MLNYSQQIDLYEAAFHRYGTSRANAVLDSGDRPVRRLEFLTACLRAIKGFFDTFFKVPASEVPSTTSALRFARHITYSADRCQLYCLAFDVYSRFGHAILVLGKLAQLNELAELSSEVGAIVNLSDTLERAAVQFDQASASARHGGLPLGDNRESSFNYCRHM